MFTFPKVFLHGVVALLALAGCQNTPSSPMDQATAPSEEASVKEITGKHPADTLGLGVPIFGTFDDIAPIFSKKNDTTYVINFWATWCKPCVAELPYFEQLRNAYDKEKVRVILVSLDFENQLEKKLKPFLEKQQLKSDVMVLLDGKYNDWIDRVTPEWSGAIPATVIYKGDNQAFHGEQFASYEELANMVSAIL